MQFTIYPKNNNKLSYCYMLVLLGFQIFKEHAFEALTLHLAVSR